MVHAPTLALQASVVHLNGKWVFFLDCGWSLSLCHKLVVETVSLALSPLHAA
jgi:hypothetical protein